MNNKTAVIFARSNHSAQHVQGQVERLRAYAAAHGYSVLGTIGLPRTSANDEHVEESIVGLIAKAPSDAHEPTVLVTDISRLGRSTTRGLHLLQRLITAGWVVVSADDSDRTAIFVEYLLENNKKVFGGQYAKNQTAGDSADAETDDGR